MLFDYHAHTPRCGHAEGPIEAYVERALALGMSEFGFSEHSPWMIQDPGQWNCLRRGEVGAYAADVARMQERYGVEGGSRPFRVRLGLEADFVPSRLATARETFARYPWDYIIGSVHHLGFWCLPKGSDAGEYARHRAEDIYELYFELVRQMVRARFCDVIAHMDLPKKHGLRIEGGALRHIEALIPDIKTAGMAVEVNTAGLDAPAGEVFPDWDAIAALHAAGVPLLVSGDSHHPSQVGRHFAATIERLRALGVRELTRFDRRRPIATALPDAAVLAAMGVVASPTEAGRTRTVLDSAVRER